MSSTTVMYSVPASKLKKMENLTSLEYITLVKVVGAVGGLEPPTDVR